MSISTPYVLQILRDNTWKPYCGIWPSSEKTAISEGMKIRDRYANGITCEPMRVVKFTGNQVYKTLAEFNMWGTDKALIDADDFCPDCERTRPHHYGTCVNRVKG